MLTGWHYDYEKIAAILESTRKRGEKREKRGESSLLGQ